MLCLLVYYLIKWQVSSQSCSKRQSTIIKASRLTNLFVAHQFPLSFYRKSKSLHRVDDTASEASSRTSSRGPSRASSRRPSSGHSTTTFYSTLPARPPAPIVAKHRPASNPLPSGAGRGALLSQIRVGKRLKKTESNDRSAARI